ncbi:unnamed protein product [Phytomonas sp. Hart1]|nr:unnamed protein product [Phytomonas sp. Hart1]|eukprot:CCW67355.1 unnamed protein product [Phytomonas sp. isolate Hart1]
MARDAKHYSSARNGGSTNSLERRGRGRGGRPGYSQLNTKKTSTVTVAQTLSSVDPKSRKYKRGRNELDAEPEDRYENFTFPNHKPSRNQNNNGKKKNSWTLTKTPKVGEYSDLATAAAIVVPSSSEAVAAQTTISLSLGPPMATSRGNFTRPNSSPGTTEFAFWHRLVDHQRLLDSLSNSGAALAASDPLDASEPMSEGSEMSLFSISEDRLRTCVQATLDLKGLITYRHRRDMDPPSLMEGWCIPRSYFCAVLALARLCESSIPTRFPPLIAADMVSPLDNNDVENEAGNEDSRAWWPSPVSLTAVQERLACARRVLQLRYVYSMLAPFVRNCNTIAELTKLLMPLRDPPPGLRAGSDRNNYWNGSNRFVSFPSTSPHRVEERVLSELLLLANQDCAIDTESWGSFATLPLLKVRNGIYTMHRASRQDTLKKLLKREEELYGLPPFLRFIRRAGVGSTPVYSHTGSFVGPELTSIPVVGVQHTTSALLHNIQNRSTNGVCADSRSGMTNSNQSYFFPSPESLEPDAFAFPDPAYYPTVQEELIEIAAKHSCFGLVIGEADHILKLWKDWALYWTHLERPQRKQEHDQADSSSPASIGTEAKRSVWLDNLNEKVRPHNNGDVRSETKQRFHQGKAESPLRDPLLPFVYSATNSHKGTKETPSSEFSLKTAASGDHGSEGSKANGSPHSVFWLCGNRWSTQTLYYGLVFEVELQSDIGKYDQGDGMTPFAPLDADSLDNKLLHKADVRGMNICSPLIYYPNCLLELSR